MRPQHPLDCIRNSRRAEFTLTKLFVGILLIILFMVILGGAYTNMAKTYEVPVSDQYDKYNSRIESITNKTTSIGKQYQGGSLSGTDTFFIAGATAYSGIQIMINAIEIPLGIISDVAANLIFIHPIFVSVLTAILAIGLVYAVGSMFLRWKF